MIARSYTIRHVLEKYLRSKFIKPNSAQQIQISVDLFCRWRGCDVTLNGMCEELVAEFLRWYYSLPRSPETVRRKRGSIITLWRFAADMGLHREPILRRIPSPKKIKRIPTSWSPAEMTRLLAACESATYPRRSSWGPPHWIALTRTLYDTSHRIGAIIATEMNQLALSSGELRLSAEQTKQRSDTFHQLSHKTVDAIRRTGDLNRSLLFPWENRREHLFVCFKRILKDAGLPHGRRDLFHRIRRTSYTQVAIRHGKSIAGEHAGHSTDMSEFYFDTSKLDRVNPVDSLPEI